MARALSTSHGFGLSRSNLIPTSLPYRPCAIKMVQKQTYWADIEADIETHLKNAIPMRDPVSVFEPMHYLTFSAPRTTAPALCIAACELVGGDRDHALAAAAAIHLMHAAAYAHQHLPLTDRPRPEPFEHKFNPNIELLTGDGIIPFGIELLSESINLGQGNADRVLRVILEITRAMGSKGLVESQYEALDMAQLDGDGGLIEYVSKKKEGELHACAAACGAIIGGGSEEEIGKLRRYGLYAGMVKGIVYGVGRNKQTGTGVEKLRGLAMKELENFKNIGKVDGVLAWLESELCKNV